MATDYKPVTLSMRPEDVETLDKAARSWAQEQGVSPVYARSAFVRFLVADCPACGGVLKPDVVFLGENVSADVVQHAYGMVDRAEALLVVGSSLAVFSGYRFVRRAKARGIPIAIVNLGPTRGDPEADLCVDAMAGEVLAELTARIVPLARIGGTNRT